MEQGTYLNDSEVRIYLSLHINDIDVFTKNVSYLDFIKVIILII